MYSGTTLAVRRLMVDAALLVAEGGYAIGTNPNIVQTDIASYEGVVTKDLDWRDLVGQQTQTAAE